jgi:hypothetical protein
MEQQTRRWVGMPALVMIVAWGAGQARPALGQSELGRGPGVYSNSNVPGAGGTAGAGVTTGMSGNPFAVPAMNPFLNPYASMYAASSPSNAALYFVAAQQSMGGIGSGQLSGTRPGPRRAEAPSPIPPDRRVSDTPGGGAARYFNRSATNQHYNRYGNYYSANGH